MRLFSNAVVRTFAPQAASSAPDSNTPASIASDPIGSNAEAAPETAPDSDPSPTSDPSRPAPDAILVDGETIVAVGTRAELLDIAAAQSSTTAALASAGGVGATTVIPGLEIDEIDCGGQVILPGFVDGHIHSIMYADSLTDLDLSQTKSLAEAVAAIRERADSLPVGTWVVGSGWDLNKWEDPSYPDRTLLDEIVPDHPVAMWSLDLHTLWANAHALEIAGIDEATPDPSGGSFVRDDDGQLTGLVREDATDLVARFIPEPSREEQVKRLATTQELFLSQGLTGIHDFDGIAATLGWNDLHEAGRQDMRVTLFLRSPEVPWAIETGWHTGDGDDWLQCGGLKLFSDGALGSHTSHMSSPFPETDGETENFGIAQMTEDELFEQAHIATEAGISVAIHAIGDQANHHVLEVFDRLRDITRAAEEKYDRPLRHRVEHAQFIQPSDVARFAELGVLASMQPRHCISDLHLLHLIDESAQLAAYAWPDLLEAGAHVVFGSDGPVEPANPFAAIYAAMTRANISGEASTTFQPHRRLSAVEAVRLHTQGPAFAAGLEARRGYLAPGMDADFILVDTDPCAAEGLSSDALTTEAATQPTDSNGSHKPADGLLGYDSEEALFAHAEAIRDTRVVLTVVGGEIKYRA
ncbi:amidohydrolase [Brevibacterium linens]|uniref:Amidohydrolase 3 n=1 Tax=Brevibacterium linens TaxID=1703 RepID=A0A0B9A6I3_BRELN|nr:amidohydrolase [Brevibacterium linens]KHS54315.1 Amidohydrolase 3 [Brevibacterium linens]